MHIFSIELASHRLISLSGQKSFWLPRAAGILQVFRRDPQYKTAPTSETVLLLRKITSWIKLREEPFCWFVLYCYQAHQLLAHRSEVSSLCIFYDATTVVLAPQDMLNSYSEHSGTRNPFVCLSLAPNTVFHFLTTIPISIFLHVYMQLRMDEWMGG